MWEAKGIKPCARARCRPGNGWFWGSTFSEHNLPPRRDLRDEPHRTGAVHWHCALHPVGRSWPLAGISFLQQVLAAQRVVVFGGVHQCRREQPPFQAPLQPSLLFLCSPTYILHPYWGAQWKPGNPEPTGGVKKKQHCVPQFPQSGNGHPLLAMGRKQMATQGLSALPSLPGPTRPTAPPPSINHHTREAPAGRGGPRTTTPSNPRAPRHRARRAGKRERPMRARRGRGQGARRADVTAAATSGLVCARGRR